MFSRLRLRFSFLAFTRHASRSVAERAVNLLAGGVDGLKACQGVSVVQSLHSINERKHVNDTYIRSGDDGQ